MDPRDALFAAIAAADAETIRRLLADDPSLAGARDADGVSAILRARYAWQPGIVAILSGIMVANVRRTSTGRRMLAVRANERAAAASGIRVARAKLLGAAIGSFVAATAGVLWGYSFQTFDASSFPAAMALAIIAFAAAYPARICSI